jgi:AbrB family looped-hinge helix DNA binding protein
MNFTVVLGKRGRVVVPADLRTALGLKAGDQLHVRIDGHHIVLERPEDAVRALRALGALRSSHAVFRSTNFAYCESTAVDGAE